MKNVKKKKKKTLRGYKNIERARALLNFVERRRKVSSRRGSIDFVSNSHYSSVLEATAPVGRVCK